MSYIEKEDENKIQKEDIKLENPLAVIIKEDTTVENVQDIINDDPDPVRRDEFKKADAIILALDPEPTKKKKSSRKAKEKEEFDKDLAFTKQSQLLGKEIQEKNRHREQEQKNKKMERGE